MIIARFRFSTSLTFTVPLRSIEIAGIPPEWSENCRNSDHSGGIWKNLGKNREKKKQRAKENSHFMKFEQVGCGVV
jgi:hypothetical protein